MPYLAFDTFAPCALNRLNSVRTSTAIIFMKALSAARTRVRFSSVDSVMDLVVERFRRLSSRG